jgi:hypothetical protein
MAILRWWLRIQWIQLVSHLLMLKIMKLTVISRKTNTFGYELYGLIEEANGKALPLGFTFTEMTDGSAKKGTMQHMLKEVLTWFKAWTWCLHIKFTLSNKDSYEINVIHLVIVRAKHQLCCWHAERYIEACLKENKLLAWYDPYDPCNAQMIFSFIDPTWAPSVT